MIVACMMDEIIMDVISCKFNQGRKEGFTQPVRERGKNNSRALLRKLFSLLLFPQKCTETFVRGLEQVSGRNHQLEKHRQEHDKAEVG